MNDSSRVPRQSMRPAAPPSPLAVDGREDAELAAIALLCLVFAWPPDEPNPLQPRSVSE